MTIEPQPVTRQFALWECDHCSDLSLSSKHEMPVKTPYCELYGGLKNELTPFYSESRILDAVEWLKNKISELEPNDFGSSFCKLVDDAFNLGCDSLKEKGLLVRSHKFSVPSKAQEPVGCDKGKVVGGSAVATSVNETSVSPSSPSQEPKEKKWREE